MEEDFHKHISVDLINLNKFPYEKTVKIKQGETYLQLKKKIQEKYKIPVKKQRIWQFIERKNKTIRPSRFKKNRDVVSRKKINLIFCEVSIYLNPLKETIFNPFQLLDLKKRDLFPSKKKTVNLFLKYFDSETESLQVVGRLCVLKETLFSEIKKLIRKWKNIPEQQTILFYEEIKHDPPRLDLLKDESDIKQAELGNGDIIIFQVEHSNKVPSYFDWFACNKRKIKVMWKPENHFRYIESFKLSILFFFLCLNRFKEQTGFKVPKFILFEIIKKVFLFFYSSF